MPTFSKLQGVVENGGQQINTQGLLSTDKALKIYTSATVTVYRTGTTTLATIYSDATGTPLANPFTADSTGFWFFFAANGIYDVKFSGGGLPAPVTRSGLSLVGGNLPTDIAYTDVANVFTEEQTINTAEASTGLHLNGGNIQLDAINPTVSAVGSGSSSNATVEVAASGKAFDIIIHGSAVGGSLGTGGPLLALLAELFANAPNIALWQFGSDGAIWFGTNDTFRAKLSSSALELKPPLQLDGATSGSVQHRAQDVAGTYFFDWPNVDPVTGYNLYVTSFSSGVVTLGYQNPSPAASADPAGIPAMLVGVSTPSQQVLYYVANYSFNLPLTGSTAVAKVAATAQTDFDIRVNGVSKGTLRFAAAATVGALVGAISSGIASGDVIEIIGPAVGDITLANIAFNLKGSVDVAPTTPIGLATMLVGLTTPSQQVYEYVANSSFTLAVTGSTAVAKIAATAQTDFVVKVNGVTKGTLRFAISGTVASVVSPTSTAIVSGDLIEIFGPATPDLTLSTIAFNLKGAT